MGVIQSLRSQATAIKAQEDTKLQISGYLGTVNKSLGSQVDQLIDGLQGAINERTKAYNGIVSKLTQQVSGKGGIGDQGVGLAFQLIKTTTAMASLVSLNKSTTTNTKAASLEEKMEKFAVKIETTVAKAYTAIYDVVTTAAYAAATSSYEAYIKKKKSQAQSANNAGKATKAEKILKVTQALLQVVSTILTGATISETVRSLTYDYRRMAAQLGYTTEGDANGDKDQGASKLLDMRDTLMLRYKPKEGPGSGPIAPDGRGYIGSLRRKI